MAARALARRALEEGAPVSERRHVVVCGDIWGSSAKRERRSAARHGGHRRGARRGSSRPRTRRTSPHHGPVWVELITPLRRPLTKVEFELAGQARTRWRPWPKAERTEYPSDVVPSVGDLYQAHALAAARTSHDVDGEHSRKQPRPRVPRPRLGLGLVWLRLASECERQLNRLGRRRS